MTLREEMLDCWKHYKWKTLGGFCTNLPQYNGHQIREELRKMWDECLIVTSHDGFETFYCLRERYLDERTWREVLRDITTNRLGG